jgi:hypothetical protein
VRDADCREIQHGTEVDGETCPARVVAAGCIDEEDVRWLRESADRGFEERALAESQQAGLVRSAGSARHDDAVAADARRGPRQVAFVARAAAAAGEADEDGADPRIGREAPRRWPKCRQPRLLGDQLLARARPFHGRIVARAAR